LADTQYLKTIYKFRVNININKYLRINKSNCDAIETPSFNISLSVKRTQGDATSVVFFIRAVMIELYRALATLIRQDVGNLSHRRAGAARNSTVHPLR